MISGDMKRPLRFSYLLALDLPAVLVLTLLIVHGVVPLYPGAPIGYSLLFALNVLLVWALNRRQLGAPGRGGAVPVPLWIAAAVFTPAGIAAIIAYVRVPNIPLAVQAGVAILLVGYIWFAV